MGGVECRPGCFFYDSFVNMGVAIPLVPLWANISVLSLGASGGSGAGGRHVEMLVG